MDRRVVKDWSRRRVHRGSSLDDFYSGRVPIHERLKVLDRTYRTGNGLKEVKEGSKELGEFEKSLLAHSDGKLTYTLAEKMKPVLDSLPVTVEKEIRGHFIHQKYYEAGELIAEVFTLPEEREADTIPLFQEPDQCHYN